MDSAAPASVSHRLILPFESADDWHRIESILRKNVSQLENIDDVINAFRPNTDQTCRFFAVVPKSAEAAKFDFSQFFQFGWPFMQRVALEMPELFAGQQVALLLGPEETPEKVAVEKVTLSRRQCACLLAHSVFGSITASARQVRKEKWAFRAAQLFFLQSIPSALCVLNYFTMLGKNGVPEGNVVFERRRFAKKSIPWRWDESEKPLCEIEFDDKGTIEDSIAEAHADFSNRFPGGGALENDAFQEEILFAIKPELIVSMALCSFMRDEESVLIHGALRFSNYSGYGSSFTYEGSYTGPNATPTVIAIDALQGMSKLQFNGDAFILRDLNKARVAFGGARTLATGNWGCGAFGNDHVLKMVQQWMAASEAGVEHVYYYTFGDKRVGEVFSIARGFRGRPIKELWAAVQQAAKQAAKEGSAQAFRKTLFGLIPKKESK